MCVLCVFMQAHLHDARVAGGGEVLDAELDRAVDAVDEAQRLQAGDGVLVLRRGLLLHVAHVRDVVADELAGEHAEVVQQVLAELRFREGVLGAGVGWCERVGGGLHCTCSWGGVCSVADHIEQN